jgi:hypothetical protein
MKARTVAKALTVTIAALVLAAGFTHAEAKSRKYHKHYSSKQKRSYGYWPGGHRMGYEADPFLYWNGPYGNYPFPDPRNFWERVQSGPFGESTSPSAF